MFNCNMVAKETQARYGMFIYTTQRNSGEECHTAVSAQMSVPKTSRISIEAKRLFLRPNWSGVKRKLKSRFRAKGKAIIHASFPVKAL